MGQTNRFLGEDQQKRVVSIVEQAVNNKWETRAWVRWVSWKCRTMSLLIVWQEKRRNLQSWWLTKAGVFVNIYSTDMTDKKGILQPVAYHRLRSLINLKRKIPVSQIPSLPQPLKLKQTQQPQTKEQKEQSMDELSKVKKTNMLAASLRSTLRDEIREAFRMTHIMLTNLYTLKRQKDKDWTV